MQDKSITELRQLAAALRLTPSGDKRRKQVWLNTLATYEYEYEYEYKDLEPEPEHKANCADKAITVIAALVLIALFFALVLARLIVESSRLVSKGLKAAASQPENKSKSNKESTKWITCFT